MIKIWTCPSCDDLVQFNNTSYNDAMCILIHGNIEGPRDNAHQEHDDHFWFNDHVEHRTASKDCSGCRSRSRRSSNIC